MRQAALHEPTWLILLALLPLLLLFHWKHWRAAHPVLARPSLPAPLQGKRQRLVPPDFLFALRALTLGCLVLGLADLKTTRTSQSVVPAQGIDIAIAMDVSASMQLEDIKPNRLEALKAVISRFVAGRTNDQLGLILYAGESITWCPLTKDYAFFIKKLNELQQPVLADGTAIGLGLASAVNALRKSKTKTKVIILLSDGENNAGSVEPAQAAWLARQHHIKVYTIGVGTTGRAPFPILDMNGVKSYHYVPVKIDETSLRNVAQKSGGKYFRAQDAASLGQIYAEIDQLEKSVVGHRTELQYTSHFRWFVLAGLMFFFTEQLLRFTLLRSLV